MGISNLLIFCSALSVTLAFPPVNLTWILPIALLPFIYILKTQNTPIKSSLLFGVLYMSFSNIWVFELIEFSSLIEIILLFIAYTLYETLFFGFMGALIKLTNKSLWALPSCWVIAEWLRASGPFGSANGVLAYSHANTVIINHFASLGSVYLSSFILVTLSCLLYTLIISIKKKNQRNSYLASAMIIAILISPHLYSLPEIDSNQYLKIGIIQSNFSMNYKMQRKNRQNIRQRYLDLSEKILKTKSLDLIIWPETITVSQNLHFKSFMNRLHTLSTTYDTAFIFGTPRKENQRYYNSAIFKYKNELFYYDKISLMPFGEYWPFKSLFKFLKLNNIIPGSEYSKGNTLHPFKLKKTLLAPAICLETTTPDIYQAYLHQRPDLLVSLVNNAWFKTSSIAERQLQMLQYRSIETGRPSIQSANFGFSCFIKGNGSIDSKLPQFTESVLTIKQPISHIETPYSKYKNTPLLSILFLSIFLGIRKSSFRRL